MKIVLFLENIPSDSGFHYSTKQGACLLFEFDRIRNKHVCKIPLEKWRENNHFLAKDLLDQMLPVPVLFDIEEEVATAEKPSKAPAPPKEPALIKAVQEKRKAHRPRGLILANALKAMDPETLEAIHAPA